MYLIQFHPMENQTSLCVKAQTLQFRSPQCLARLSQYCFKFRRKTNQTDKYVECGGKYFKCSLCRGKPIIYSMWKLTLKIKDQLVDLLVQRHLLLNLDHQPAHLLLHGGKLALQLSNL